MRVWPIGRLTNLFRMHRFRFVRAVMIAGWRARRRFVGQEPVDDGDQQPT
jgi:hypothetical protein